MEAAARYEEFSESFRAERRVPFSHSHYGSLSVHFPEQYRVTYLRARAGETHTVLKSPVAS